MRGLIWEEKAVLPLLKGLRRTPLTRASQNMTNCSKWTNLAKNEPTVTLATSSTTIVSLIVSMPLGLLAAQQEGTAFDRRPHRRPEGPRPPSNARCAAAPRSSLGPRRAARRRQRHPGRCRLQLLARVQQVWQPLCLLIAAFQPSRNGAVSLFTSSRYFAQRTINTQVHHDVV